MIKCLVPKNYSVEISGNLHRLFWMQIRNWIYHTEKDSKYIKDGVISWADVFKGFAELFDGGILKVIFFRFRRSSRKEHQKS